LVLSSTHSRRAGKVARAPAGSSKSLMSDEAAAANRRTWLGAQQGNNAKLQPASAVRASTFTALVS
jgi:hypothetical protein